MNGWVDGHSASPKQTQRTGAPLAGTKAFSLRGSLSPWPLCKELQQDYHPSTKGGCCEELS